MSRVITLSCLAWLAFAATPDPVNPDPESPRPIEAVDTVFIEDMTWMEVRDALRSGKDTVIVATGGVEQNGPYLVTGKHNVILRATTEAIARKLGDTLVAPVVPFVPEGDINPPSSHMRYPGTISVTEATYEALLTDICGSLRAHGFKRIILIGDSGGNQDGMKNIAMQMNQSPDGGRLYYIPEYYDFSRVSKWLEEQGIRQTPEGLHDDFAMTAMMMSVDARSVRAEQRMAAGNFRINGVDLVPAEQTINWGKRIINFRAEITVEAITKALSR